MCHAISDLDTMEYRLLFSKVLGSPRDVRYTVTMNEPLLKKLTEAHGVPGQEDAIRSHLSLS